MLLKDKNEPPLICDQVQYDHFVWDFENLAQQIAEDLDRPHGDAYRDAIEFKRAEIRKWCALILNKLQGTEDKSAPRAALFSLPLEEMGRAAV